MLGSMGMTGYVRGGEVVNGGAGSCCQRRVPALRNLLFYYKQVAATRLDSFGECESMEMTGK